MTLLNSPIPSEFFTGESLATLTGATGAVYIICGTIQKVFNYSPKWFALLVSVVISFIGVSISGSTESGIVKYTIALLNGFLIYATSTGANQIVSNFALPANVNNNNSKSISVETNKFLTASRKGFFSSWW